MVEVGRAAALTADPIYRYAKRWAGREARANGTVHAASRSCGCCRPQCRLSTHYGRFLAARAGARTAACLPANPRNQARSLPAGDFRLVSDWIELKRQTIVDHWDGKLSVSELVTRLRKI